MIARFVLGLFAVFAVAYGVVVTVMLVIHFRGGQVDSLGQFAFFSKFFGPIALGVWVAGTRSESERLQYGAGAGLGGLVAAELVAHLVSLTVEPGLTRDHLEYGVSAPLWITPALFLCWAAVRAGWPVAER